GRIAVHYQLYNGTVVNKTEESYGASVNGGVVGPHTYFVLNQEQASIWPLAPTRLSALPLAFDRVKLVWLNLAGDSIAGFKIYRNGVEVAATTDTDYTDIGLDPGTLYRYQVRAYSSTGELTDFSNTTYATTFSYTYPGLDEATIYADEDTLGSLNNIYKSYSTQDNYYPEDVYVTEYTYTDSAGSSTSYSKSSGNELKAGQDQDNFSCCGGAGSQSWWKTWNWRSYLKYNISDALSKSSNDIVSANLVFAPISGSANVDLYKSASMEPQNDSAQALWQKGVSDLIFNIGAGSETTKIDVTDRIKAAVDNNDGSLFYQLKGSGSSYKTFASSDHSNVIMRPRLIIIYKELSNADPSAPTVSVESGVLKAGVENSDTDIKHKRSFFKFDLSGINKPMVNATLYLDYVGKDATQLDESEVKVDHIIDFATLGAEDWDE
ncbi:hypothetical protein LCGC14_2564020, partial [marine sediment metagenome]